MDAAAVLWTGGKDSALALFEAREAGYAVNRLVTFAPPQPDFLAHPLPVLARQAEALGLPHEVLTVNEPHGENYRAHLRRLHSEESIATLITGDIAEVAGQPNWIRACCETTALRVFTPLWGRDRLALLKRLLALRFRVLVSCAKAPWFTPDWVGREIDEALIATLVSVRARTHLDLCGEEGEYHTLVLDCPLFNRELRLTGTSRHSRGGLHHLRVQGVELVSKGAGVR